MAGLDPKNAAVRRILSEVKEIEDNPSTELFAMPLEDNVFEWHFVLRGPAGTSFEGGVYHGRLMLAADYPFKPPDLYIDTPNGRFKTNTKVCLSISGFHPESWQPSWSIRMVLLALQAFFPTSSDGAIGAIDMSHEDRVRLARKSQSWSCPKCGLSSSFGRSAMDEKENDETEESKDTNTTSDPITGEFEEKNESLITAAPSNDALPPGIERENEFLWSTSIVVLLGLIIAILIKKALV